MPPGKKRTIMFHVGKEESPNRNAIQLRDSSFLYGGKAPARLSAALVIAV